MTAPLTRSQDAMSSFTVTLVSVVPSTTSGGDSRSSSSRFTGTVISNA